MDEYRTKLKEIMNDSTMEDFFNKTLTFNESQTTPSPIINEQDNNTNDKYDSNNEFQQCLNQIKSLLFTTKQGEPITTLSEIFPELNNTKMEKPIHIDERAINPLDYIDSYEKRIYNEILHNDFEKSLILKKLQKQTTHKEPILTLQPSNYIINKLPNNFEEISCMIFKNNIILLGYHNGMTKLFEHPYTKENKTFLSNEIIKLDSMKEVLCLDINNTDNNYLAVGHRRGSIVIWEISSGKQKVIIRDHEQINSVINIKFLGQNGKDFSLIASDLGGLVNYYSIKHNFFNTAKSVTTQIQKTDKGFFLLETFGYTSYELKKFNINTNNTNTNTNTNNANTALQNYIAVIGNIEFVEIFLFKPDEIESIKKISNPTNEEIPDACFGFGCIKHNNSHQQQQPQPLLVISWNTSIMIFIVIIKQERIVALEETMNIEIDIPIVKIGFIDVSMLYIVDLQKRIQVLNIFENNKLYINNSNSYQRLIDQREEVNINEIVYSNKFEVDSEKNIQKELYYFSISSWSKTILIFCENKFYEVKQKHLEEYLTQLNNNHKWEELFCTGIDIINNNITGLTYNSKNTKSKSQIIRQTVNSYIKEKVNSNQTPKVSDLQIVFEFLLNIDELDYLLNDVKQLICNINKDYLIMFYNILESFILSGELLQCYNNSNNTHHNKVSLVQMMNEYIDMKQLYTLSKLLPHLPLEYINQKETLELCTKYHLITTFIVVHNGLHKSNILLPFIQIFDAFVQAKEEFNIQEHVNDPNDINFYSLYKQKDIPNEIFEYSKEYLGHKLFWYIRLVLNNQTFPNKEINFDTSIYNYLINELFNWYTSENVIDTLVHFDSYNYFNILILFFYDNIFDIIKDNESLTPTPTPTPTATPTPTPTPTPTGDNDTPTPTPTPEPSQPRLTSIIHSIINKCTATSKCTLFIKEDLYEFILKVHYIIPMQPDILLQAIHNILLFHIEFNNNYDKFKCHYPLIFKQPQYINELSNIYLNPIIESMLITTKNENEVLYEQQYNKLIHQSENSPFKNIKVRLYQLNNDYKNALTTIIENQLHNKLINSSNEYDAFTYINQLLTQNDIIKVNPTIRKEIETFIMEKLPSLGEISINDVYNLINDVFHDKQHKAFQMFDHVPHLQYELLDKYNKQIENEGTYHQSKLNVQLFLKQIELMITLNYKHLILTKINKKPISTYPINECLKLCKEHNVIDACMYLCMKKELYQEALDIGLNEIKNIFTKTKLSLSLNQHEYPLEYQHNITMLHTYITQCAVICEQSLIKTTQQNASQLWLYFLDEICLMINSLSNVNATTKMSVAFKKSIFTQLQEFIKQMCCYVSTQSIIEILYNNFQGNEFSLLNKLIEQMMKTFSNIDKLLKSTKGIQKSFIQQLVGSYIKEKEKGNTFVIDVCDYCKQKMDKSIKGAFYFFGCGHVVHAKCVERRNERKGGCPVCENEEDDDNGDNMGDNDDVNMLKLKQQQQQQQDEEMKMEMLHHFTYQHTVKKNNIHKKLHKYDKSYCELLDMMTNDDDYLF